MGGGPVSIERVRKRTTQVPTLVGRFLWFFCELSLCPSIGPQLDRTSDASTPFIKERTIILGGEEIGVNRQKDVMNGNLEFI